jgi:hypothetical protein
MGESDSGHAPLDMVVPSLHRAGMSNGAAARPHVNSADRASAKASRGVSGRGIPSKIEGVPRPGVLDEVMGGNP